MKTNNINQLADSNALKEVWSWKEMAYEETRNMSVEELQAHYKSSAEKAAMLLGTKIIQTESGAYKFAK